MWVFIARRLAALPPLLLVVSFFTYLLMQAAPGDYYSRLEADPKASQDYVMLLRRDAGKAVAIAPDARAEALGRFVVHGRAYSFGPGGRLHLEGKPVDPATQQEHVKRFTPEGGDEVYSVTATGAVYRYTGALEAYFRWLSRVVQLEFGESWSQKESVEAVIGNRVLNTLFLSAAALLIAWGLAIPLGVWSGVRPNSLVDHVCGGVAYVSLSVPSVFLALLAVLFAYLTGWFPVGNMRDIVNWDRMGLLEKAADLAHHLVLPAFVVGLTALAGYMRQMRSQMVETMSADYIRTARAKGLSARKVTFKHALRNAVNPLVTLFGFSLAALLSGSFLVEVVMNWPGLARLTVDAVFALDEPLVMASILMAAVLLVVGNLVADVLLVVVDPRIRVG